MKISGKMWLIIILKSNEKQGFSLSLENILSEKTTAGPPTFLGLRASLDVTFPSLIFGSN